LLPRRTARHSARQNVPARLPNAMARFTITAIHSDPARSGAEEDEHEEADGGLLQAAALTPNAGGNGSRLESLLGIGTPYCQATHLPALLPIAVAGPSMHSRFPPQGCVTPSSPLDEAEAQLEPPSEAQLEPTGAQAEHGVPPASGVGYGLDRGCSCTPTAAAAACRAPRCASDGITVQAAADVDSLDSVSSAGPWHVSDDALRHSAVSSADGGPWATASALT
jgi:hypothetical protein